jgi:hypothetical protein
LAQVPDFGDGGYLGNPSISTSRRPEAPHPDIEDLVNFGFIDLGYQAIGLETLGLYRYRRFLSDHPRHPVVLFTDEAEPHVPPSVREHVRRANARPIAERALASKAAVRSWRPPFEQPFELLDYVVDCHSCTHDYAMGWDGTALRPLASHPLGGEVVQTFREHVLTPDVVNFYRIDTLLTPDEEYLQGLAAFLDHHEGHRLVAFTRSREAKS